MYNLTVSGKQAELISRAMELYSRIHGGQLDEICFMALCGEFAGKEGHVIDGGRVRACCDMLKCEIFGFSSSESWGITSSGVSDNARIAWDIYQVMRHRLAWDKAGNPPKRDWRTMMQVFYDEPLPTSVELLPVMQQLVTSCLEIPETDIK